MPLLFALIGAEVNVEYMESRLIGKCFGVPMLGISVTTDLFYFIGFAVLL